MGFANIALQNRWERNHRIQEMARLARNPPDLLAWWKRGVFSRRWCVEACKMAEMRHGLAMPKNRIRLHRKRRWVYHLLRMLKCCSEGR